MKQFFKTIKRYCKLLAVFARYSLMSQLEYRINFVAGVAVEMGYLIIKLLYVAVIYQAGVSIGGFSPDHFAIFIGTYIVMTGLYMMYYADFTSLPDHVRQGNLDMFIVKPVSLQFMISFRVLDFAMPIPCILGGGALIIYGWHQAGIPASPLLISGFLLFMASGAFLTYSIFLIPHLLCFWFVSARGIIEMTAAVWDFNNMPQVIYGRWMQRIGTFILPVFIITNFPGLFVMDKLSPFLIFWGIAAPVIFFIIGRLIFRRAVKNYTSASC